MVVKKLNLIKMSKVQVNSPAFIFNNTNCVKATAQYQNIHFQFFRHFIIEFRDGILRLSSVSSVNNISAIKSTLLLEMKCPQLKDEFVGIFFLSVTRLSLIS